MCVMFFFKQKTAYDMRMSDWSSDVCSSELIGHAREIADGQIGAGAEELRLEYPFTVERAVSDPGYLPDMAAFYDDCATRVAARLDAGTDVAVLCEGDPFFYGSFMYLFDLLAERDRPSVVSGTSV